VGSKALEELGAEKALIREKMEITQSDSSCLGIASFSPLNCPVLSLSKPFFLDNAATLTKAWE